MQGYLRQKGIGVFGLQAGQRCPSTYRRRSREFFGCAWGKGVSLPTTEGDGVFWLRVGRGCPPSYRRGGMEFFGCRQSEGVSLPTTEGQEQKNAHPQAGWAVVGYCGRIIGVQRILYARIWMVRQIALTLSRIIRHIRIIRLAILVSAESAL